MKAHVFAAVGLLALPPMCSSKDGDVDPTSVPIESTLTGPDAAPKVMVKAQPVTAFSDAGAPDDKSPYEQAKEYHARGQNWVARLLVEKQALSPAGTKDEAELLLEICKAQGDAACVQECAHKLGRKIAFDGGVAPGPAISNEHPQETPFSKARDLHLKKKLKEARAILEPRVIDGKAAPEETKLLLQICTTQNDKMCVALCKKQLGG